MSLNALLKSILCTQSPCHLPLFLSYRLYEWQHAGLLSRPLCHGLPRHDRLFRQQHPPRNGVLLDAFTAPGNACSSHRWQAGRAGLSTDHMHRQTHPSWLPSLSHCPAWAGHCQPTNLICKRHCRGRVLLHERHKNCLATFHSSNRRTAFSSTEMHINPCHTWQTHTAELLGFLP